jgi:hypothetical protein
MLADARHQILRHAIIRRPFLSLYVFSVGSTSSGLRSFHSCQPRPSRVPSDTPNIHSASVPTNTDRKSEEGNLRYSTLGRLIRGVWHCQCHCRAVCRRCSSIRLPALVLVRIRIVTYTTDDQTREFIHQPGCPLLKA